MSNSNQHVRERQRLDFAKIQSSIQIPNLIEVQMKSYQRFLQMDLLPSERDDGGLAVGVHFRVSDQGFPRNVAAGIRGLRDRQLGVQVRQPEGAASPARHVPELRRVAWSPIRIRPAT